jgi:hypothetical protein
MNTNTAKHFDYPRYRAWLAAFNEKDRQQQLKDDAAAWERVTGILLVAISLGLLISISAVVIALIMS